MFISNHIDMNKSDLKKLKKSELIRLLLKQCKKTYRIGIVDDEPVSTPQTVKPIPKPRNIKPIPKPRKSVKKIVKKL